MLALLLHSCLVLAIDAWCRNVERNVNSQILKEILRNQWVGLVWCNRRLCLPSPSILFSVIAAVFELHGCLL